MCLAVSGRLVSVQDGEGRMDCGGVTKSVELTLVPDARVGDTVLVHAGFAIAVLDEQAGDELLRLTAEVASYGKA